MRLPRTALTLLAIDLALGVAAWWLAFWLRFNLDVPREFVALAAQSGHEETSALLERVVEVEDPATGRVRLRREVTAADEMTLDVRSTRTARVREG